METELFVHFAEIAGVFVGFGALISMRSAQPSDVHDVVYLRAVLMCGLWVVVAALVPIALSRYGVADHTLWLSSALVGLALWAVAFAVDLTSSRALDSSPERVDRLYPIVGLPLNIFLAGSLILIILGVRPSIDDAVYVTALTAGVVFAGYTLLALVLSQKPAPTDTGLGHDAQDPANEPAVPPSSAERRTAPPAAHSHSR